MDIDGSFLEITQQIFSYLPIKPLLTQVSAVCHQWHEAIQSISCLTHRFLQFRQWSKFHLQYEYGEKQAVNFIDSMFHSSENAFQTMLQ